MRKLQKETKQGLDRILNRVGLELFYMAVSTLYDVGYSNMTEDNMKATVESIEKEEEPQLAVMTNRFKIHLMETAFEISKAAMPLELAQYISKN